MAIDVTTDNQYPMNREPQSEHDRSNDKKAMYISKITKECVDRLIEDIDKTLKASK